MSTIHLAIQNAQIALDEALDRFERGDGSRREVIHAQRRLNALRAERDLEMFLARKNYQTAAQTA